MDTLQMFSSNNLCLQSFSDDPRNKVDLLLLYLSSSETARPLLDSLFLFLTLYNLTTEPNNSKQQIYQLLPKLCFFLIGI